MYIRMTRIEPDRNIRRFYAVDVCCNLFGEWTCVRRCGRVGSKGRILETVFCSQELAAAEADNWFRQKRGRGHM